MNDVIKDNLIRLGIRPGDMLGVAVSGGVDSMVLLHCVAHLREQMGISVAAYHLEHGIRGQQSCDDMAFVKAQCNIRNIQCITDRTDIPAVVRMTGQSVEAAARQARYAFFDRQKADFIATAHHMGDMAETVVMNLVRGAGMKGLCGIPQKRGRYIRPMLDVSRQDIEDYAKNNGIAYVQDSTNEDTAHTRNYIRHEIIPRLKNINDAACANIARTAALLREDEDALSQWADSIDCIDVRDDGIYIDMAALMAQHNAVRKRIVRRAIAQADDLRDIENVHVQSVLDLAQKAESGKRLDIGNGLFSAVVYDKLMIGKNRTVGYNNSLVSFDGQGRYAAFGTTLTCSVVQSVTEYGGCAEYFNADALLNAQFRHRQTGDRIIPIGMSGTKRLSDYLSDKKVPLHKRDDLIVLADGNDVFWVVGIGVSDVSKVKEGCKILKIEYGENWYA